MGACMCGRVSLPDCRSVGVSSADAAEGGLEETGLGRAPQSRPSSGDGRGCRLVAGIGAVMTNGSQLTGDGSLSAIVSSVVGLLSLSSISPETERLRSLRVLQKQVARPQEAVGQRLRIILSRKRAIESGWDGLGAWAGRLSDYTKGKKSSIFLARIYRSHMSVSSGSREASGLGERVAKRGFSIVLLCSVVIVLTIADRRQLQSRPSIYL